MICMVINGKEMDISFIKEEVNNLSEEEKKLYIYFSESHRGDTQARIKCFKEYGYTEIYKNWQNLIEEIRKKLNLEDTECSRLLLEVSRNEKNIETFEGKTYKQWLEEEKQRVYDREHPKINIVENVENEIEKNKGNIVLEKDSKKNNHLINKDTVRPQSDGSTVVFKFLISFLLIAFTAVSGGWLDKLILWVGLLFIWYNEAPIKKVIKIVSIITILLLVFNGLAEYNANQPGEFYLQNKEKIDTYRKNHANDWDGYKGNRRNSTAETRALEKDGYNAKTYRSNHGY